MGKHLPRPEHRPSTRRRTLGALLIALGAGLLAFAFLDEDGRPVISSPTATSAPTVLGAVVERPAPTSSTAPGADPAAPVTFQLPDRGPTSTASRPSAPSSTAPARPAVTTTTTEPAVLIPPTMVTNTTIARPTGPTTTTTTTTSEPDPTTTDPTTTTTEAEPDPGEG